MTTGVNSWKEVMGDGDENAKEGGCGRRNVCVKEERVQPVLSGIRDAMSTTRAR
jgi:hypothetical protein